MSCKLEQDQGANGSQRRAGLIMFVLLSERVKVRLAADLINDHGCLHGEEDIF